jgi:alkaline phosphatase D
VDVTGLQPNTYYYFEFESNGVRSLIGRTKTTPSTIDNINQLRFAVVSCSNYPNGFFNVYEKIYERNDLDAVIHLGDYIYEYGSSNPDRPVLPDKEIVELSDYRLRHSTYKLDYQSRLMHQQYPLIATWDDHESTNNSWRDGAENHNPGEGDWQVRKSRSMQAYYEWMPLRLPDPNNDERIWRKISYGNLADILVLDTRLYDRDEQDISKTNNPDHKLIGPEQMAWLENELINGDGQWKIIAQQVMMSNLVIPIFNIPLNSDQWDGYNTERKALYDIILNNNVNNVVVLTGDIHTAWGNDLPYDLSTYPKGANRGSVAVEFVTTSVTSSSSPIPLPPAVYQLIRGALPHIKYVNLFHKGYNVLDLTPQKATNDFYTINTIKNTDATEVLRNQFFVNNNERFLRNPGQPKNPTIDSRPLQYQAPLYPRSNANRVAEEPTLIKGLLTTLGIYPNPFMSQVSLQYNVQEKSSTNIRMFDISGKLVREKNYLEQDKGMYIETIDTQNLPTGTYTIEIMNGNDRNTHTVVKM